MRQSAGQFKTMQKQRELIFSVTKKDLDIQFYKASGKGGQNRNKRETAVRIVHKDSGVTVVAADERMQHQNLQIAFRRLTQHEQFKKWLHIEAARRMYGKREIESKINKMVDEDMAEKNLKIEYYEPINA